MTREIRDQLAQLALDEVSAEDAVRNFRYCETSAKTVSSELGLPLIGSK
jgi:hypothetical protein